MHLYNRKRKRLLLTVRLAFVLAILVYLSYHFQQTIAYITGFTTSVSWASAVLLAVAMASIALYTKKMIMGFLIYLSFACFICDVISLAIHCLFPAKSIWWIGGISPYILTCILSVISYITARHIRIKHYSIKMRNAPAAKVVLISDMHLGTNIRSRDFERIVKAVNGLNADFIMLGGDIYEERTNPEEYISSLAAFNSMRAAVGKYYVLGNHEYTAMRRGQLNAHQLRADLHAAGVSMLRDEVINTGGYTIIGRDDVCCRRGLGELMRQAAPGMPVIVLDHHPSEYKNAASLGVKLHLAGHSHAGQMLPVGRLGEWVGHSELMYGHRMYGDMHAIVSAGIGTWGFPMRLGVPGEITVVDIAPEQLR